MGLIASCKCELISHKRSPHECAGKLPLGATTTPGILALHLILLDVLGHERQEKATYDCALLARGDDSPGKSALAAEIMYAGELARAPNGKGGAFQWRISCAPVRALGAQLDGGDEGGSKEQQPRRSLG